MQSWDTANKAGLTNDYSVCSTWLVRDETYFLLDIFRERLEFPALRRKVIEHASLWRADRLVIEDAASGEALLQELASRPPGATWWAEPIHFDKDKVLRAEANSVPIENGQVYLPRKAPWLDALCQEIRHFPRGAHDDQVDSISQFLAWVRTRIKYATKLNATFPY